MSYLVKYYKCSTKIYKSSIDVILTNKEDSFQLTKMTETGASAFLEEVKLKRFSRKSDDSN